MSDPRTVLMKLVAQSQKVLISSDYSNQITHQNTQHFFHVNYLDIWKRKERKELINSSQSIIWQMLSNDF